MINTAVTTARRPHSATRHCIGPTVGVPAADREPSGRRLSLAALLHSSIQSPSGQHLGRLADVIVSRQREDFPVVTGVLADIGAQRVLLPTESISAWHANTIHLSSATVDLHAFDRRPSDILCSVDLHGQRVIDIAQARVVRVYDVYLTETNTGWKLTHLGTRPPRWWQRTWQRLIAPPRPPTGNASVAGPQRPFVPHDLAARVVPVGPARRDAQRDG